MIKILKNFIFFFKTPSKKGNSFSQDFLLFIFIFSLNLITIAIKHWVTKEPLIDDSDFKFLTPSKLFSYILLIPLIEEFTFRGFLNFKRRYIYVLTILSLTFFSFSFIKQTEIQTIFFLVYLPLSVLFFFHKKLYHLLLGFISKNLSILIILSSVLFGVIHLDNYNEFEMINLLPIIQKIIGGLFLAYIAYKYNIWISYIFHILNNMIPFMIIYVFK